MRTIESAAYSMPPVTITVSGDYIVASFVARDRFDRTKPPGTLAAPESKLYETYAAAIRVGGFEASADEYARKLLRRQARAIETLLKSCRATFYVLEHDGSVPEEQLCTVTPPGTRASQILSPGDE